MRGVVLVGVVWWGQEGRRTSEGDSAGNIVPPAAVDARVADYDEEGESEAELEAAEVVEEIAFESHDSVRLNEARKAVNGTNRDRKSRMHEHWI